VFLKSSFLSANPGGFSLTILHFGVRLEWAAFVLLGGVEQYLVPHFFSLNS